ncbi:MAG: 16S rRNA (cytidine(1402)-2'-O)-methyltransferase [Clostridium sp.]|uniref:16S rRNA (cytidine(1402)-2'-O)-methyltransferase n=1 Tax=Clostridium culturomicium TaxID=1499683 RepID=UPI000591058D|nr:16S rRNA (cytidine(1402)-2'-O)-methyltransferase [Clostridium culturomicium]MDU4892307.1 16S rRNA (cytidine(1402)-2'-O)-methyltransferase [Clostridium sp.]MDU7085681.1 16S rRNA (cytidine(1402)-2'-O)-methyltransferase [Clostridium sp.]
MSGKLYLIPTPIGNLKDITLRALETLKSVDLIACEDTRQSLKLLNHFGIKKTLVSYHKHNENGKSEDIIKRLLEGQNIAIISDAGTPGISDPGAVIAKRCIEENIEFEVYPGATAITTALVYSGLDTDKFIFVGFLSRENKDRKETMNSLVDRQETIILYEAPHRIQSTLSFIREVLGNRRIAVCKELTKLHETILRGTVDECIKYYEENAPRGEYVIVISGKSKEEIIEEKKLQWEELTVEEHIMKFISEGKNKKEAVKLVAKERGLHKSEIYKYSLDL